MKALFFSIWLQFKLDIRNKNILTAYYVLPIAFYLVIGAIFKQITPNWSTTLLQAMSVLAISIAAFLGTPAPITDFFTSDIKKTYQVGNINLSVILISTFISAVFHMLIITVFIYLTAPLIFGVSTVSISASYFGWILLTIVVSTCLGILVGLVSKTNSMMTMISQLVFLPTILIGGIILPTHILPDFLQKFGNILPATYSIRILNSLDAVNWSMIYPLIIIGIVGLLLLITVYRIKLHE